MRGYRIADHRFQGASQSFEKNGKKLNLVGMLHWGTNEYFQRVQGLINKCQQDQGSIIFEDTNFLDPPELITLSDDDFLKLNREMRRNGNPTHEMMYALLRVQYQWDTLRYPGPPHALCADVSFRERAAFDKYLEAIGEKHKDSAKDYETRNLLMKSGEEGHILYSEIMRLSYAVEGRDYRKWLFNKFDQWAKRPGFTNPQKAREILEWMTGGYGTGNPDSKPEWKAFLDEKREQRVLKLSEKVEPLDEIKEILVTYGAGHFYMLKRGMEKRKWRPASDIVWHTAWIFPQCTTTELIQALDSVANTKPA